MVEYGRLVNLDDWSKIGAARRNWDGWSNMGGPLTGPPFSTSHPNLTSYPDLTSQLY